jgi:tetratricopeptide (TPR) repeat protein
MGNTCYELGEYEEAKDYFVRVLDIHKSEFIYEKYLACVAALEEKYKIKYNDEPYNIEYVIEYAKTKYQQEKPAEAVELLKKITPNEKNIIKYMHIMGAAYMEMGKYELAQGYLEKCISYTEKLNDDVPNSDERLQLLSRAYQNMAKVLEEQKRYDEAYEYLDKALKTGIHILDIMESKAIFLYHEKKYRDSIKAADNIFKYDANSLTGHMVKGDSLKELEYYSEALEEMDKCIRIEPYNVMNYIYKIEVLFLLGQYDDIKEIIRYLRDKGVKELIVDKWDAAIEGKTGDYRKALDMLNKIIAQIENCTDDYEKSILAASYFEVARISLNVEKKSDKAMEYLDKALELKPDYAEALSYKGYILFIEGSYNEAIEVYLKLLENKPLHFSANEILGEIYEKKNELKKAIEYYTRQIEIAPNNYVYMSRGYVYSLLNMFEEARDDYRQNIEIEPERFNTYRHMANTYTYEEQEEKAIPLYEKALNTENGDKDQWCYIDYSLALERMGNIDKAIELLNECSYKFKNDEILLRIARAYCIAGKYELAENIYYKYAANGEKNKYVVIRDICECISHMGREEEALNIINNLFQNLNEEVAAHTDLSSLKMVEICLKHKNGNCDEFEKDIKEAVGYFLKSGVGNPQSLILLRYVNELRKHQLDEIEFKSDIMKEVVSTMKDYYVYIDVDNNVQEYSDIMCDKAVISLEEGDLEKALSYADAALNHKKCHTCDFCKCADGYFIKAIILELMGRKEESFKCYESAAKYDATDIFFEVEYERVCTNNPDGRAEFEI